MFNLNLNLNKREKRLIQALIALISISIIYFFIISPIVNLKNSIETEFNDNFKKLNKLETLYEQYKEIKDKKSYYQTLIKNTKSTTTLVEESAQSANILRNKVHLSDHPMNVQNNFRKISTSVRFEGVDITSLLDFIYKMENSNSLVRISQLNIRQAIKGRNTYDVNIQFETLSSQ